MRIGVFAGRAFFGDGCSYKGFGNARCAGVVHERVQGWRSLYLVKFAIVNFIANNNICYHARPANCAKTISKLLYYFVLLVY